jgi:hypothetical protein
MPLSDPLDEVELVIAYAAHVTPTQRARTFLQYAKDALAGPDTPRATG